MNMDYKLTFFNALKADFVRIARFKIYIILLLFPIACMLMLYSFTMNGNAIEFYSQSNTLKQFYILFGTFIAAFLPFLITTIMHSTNDGNREAKTVNTNSLIPMYVRILSRISVSLILTLLSLLILILLISGQILFLNLTEGLAVNLGSAHLSKLLFYLILLPVLILPLLELIALIQSYTKNIILSFILPLVASFGGNVLAIGSNEYIIFSPINSSVAIMKPILTPFMFDFFNFVIVIGVCVASIIIFSYLTVLRGIKGN